MTKPRQVYMVLSPRSLSYAQGALESLLSNSVEPMHLHLITDSDEDAELLRQATSRIDASSHTVIVYTGADLDEREAELFARHTNLRAFRRGHPCWRKITDPLLLSEPGEEMVLLDPDLYFPNHFCFETTPQSGLLLMWQLPNCLYPPEIVKTAMQSDVRLAHHVDIGVAHWRANVDLDWLDWLVETLGGASLPRLMHVEAIVWAALAMRIGGGHLDPTYWKCWRRSPAKRIMRKLGVGGLQILKSEDWASMKCFHAGGEAKNWLKEARENGLLETGSVQNKPGPIVPFIELTPEHYAREMAFKRLLQSLGYYRIFRTA
ncbi:hypothetical protein ACFPT7_06295 [Acidicapsa dinghuensis]|uniref:Glycosyltransferase family 2 protein n=1 Tax=Acidicapsa dinghuensis TaxID=2218256 RepID=A0ABW1EC55_9BACT|nr:hypothetical protein [Acidicapsa dinghuensis]